MTEKLFTGTLNRNQNKNKTKRVNKLKSKELNDIFINSDIVLLTECWTNKFSDLSFPDFQSFALHRKLKKKKCKNRFGGYCHLY